jgi:hypothetical protein
MTAKQTTPQQREDGAYVFTLSKPLRVAGAETDHFTMRPPTLGDMDALEPLLIAVNGSGEAKIHGLFPAAQAAIYRLIDIPEAQARNIPLTDIMPAVQLLMSFLGESLAIGGME